MKTRRSSFLVLLALMAGFVAGPGVGQQSKGDATDKEAIAKNAEAFIEAFGKGDAAALAAFWTPDGDYTTSTGRRFQGREAIEKSFRNFLAENKGLTVRIESESLRFVTPEVAIEDGTNIELDSGGSPSRRARYTVVHVKKDGKWFLSSVREAPFVPPSNHEQLGGLAWAIGEWSAKSDRGDAEHLSVSWTDNQNFIIGTFASTAKGVSVGEATHWIGWDPQAKRIRSWIFDASGGFGEGAWTRDGDHWVIKTKSVHQDGKNAMATYHISRVDGDTLRLQGTDRTVDGKAIPDTKEFKLKRVHEEPPAAKSARQSTAPSLRVGVR